jgi:DNA-binding response OmpR family regulator
MRLLLLLTDDRFLAEVLGSYLRGDGIEVVPVASIAEAEPHIGEGASGMLVDLSKRDVAGEDIVVLSFRTRRARIPLLLISAQPRQDVAEFATVVHAADVVSKTERMTAIAARLRICLNGSRVNVDAPSGFAIPALSVSSV